MSTPKKPRPLCIQCNENIVAKPKSSFCSLTCSGKYTREKRVERDLKLFKQGKLKRRAWIRVILLKIFGHVCSMCRRKKWNGKPITLWVDHIDGNAANNKPKNFRLMCPNCDSQLPTFGGKNRGNGRKSRGLPQYG